MEVLNNIPPVGQALVAGLFTWGLTALGAAMVFFSLKRLIKRY